MALVDSWELNKLLNPSNGYPVRVRTTEGDIQGAVLEVEHVQMARTFLDPDELDALGVLLQYAAMKARENGEANAAT